MNRHLTVLLLLSSISSATIAATSNLPCDLTLETLESILADNSKDNEARPMGVPPGFDWSKKPKRGSWNTPAKGFEAATGWGQIFYKNGGEALKSKTIYVRGNQSYVCQNLSDGIQWLKVQRGQIEGRQFRADFAGNINSPARTFKQTSDEAEISFDIGNTFHFWPRGGRFNLPSKNLCGFLFLLQARQGPGEVGSLLIGLGADYWTTTTAPWDNYKTNRDIAIGRLQMVGESWKWVGLTTANAEALGVLVQDGYKDCTLIDQKGTDPCQSH